MKMMIYWSRYNLVTI